MDLRLDAHGLSEEATLFAERELESVREEVLRKKTEPLSLQDWIEADTSEDPFAEYVVHQMYELLGVAQPIADATEDLPLVDLSVTEEQYQSVDYGCAYRHTFKEIERAQARNKQLDRRRAEAARRATEEKLNQVGWFGDPDGGIFGAINNPSVPREILAEPIDSSTQPQVIIDQLRSLVSESFETTRQNERLDTMLMATDPHSHIANTVRDPSSGTDTTIKEFLIDKNPHIETITTIPELDGAGPNGEDLIYAFNSDQETMMFKLNRPFEQMSPQDDNLTVKTNCVAATSGTVYNYPLGAVVAEIPKS